MLEPRPAGHEFAHQRCQHIAGAAVGIDQRRIFDDVEGSRAFLGKPPDRPHRVEGPKAAGAGILRRRGDELEASDLELRREKPNGKFAPWLFRFAAFDAEGEDQDVESGTGDTSLSRDKPNKTVFSGQITIGAGSNVFQTCWADLIRAAKKALPCWNVDTQVIWDRFLAFNRSRGNDKVPAGYLLGFMRRWRTSPGTVRQPSAAPTSDRAPDPRERELHDQIKAAPSGNRQFHASDLCRLIGQAGYEARVLDVVRQFGCPRFTATLAVHGRAVMAGEIRR